MVKNNVAAEACLVLAEAAEAKAMAIRLPDCGVLLVLSAVAAIANFSASVLAVPVWVAQVFAVQVFDVRGGCDGVGARGCNCSCSGVNSRGVNNVGDGDSYSSGDGAVVAGFVDLAYLQSGMSSRSQCWWCRFLCWLFFGRGPDGSGVNGVI